MQELEITETTEKMQTMGLYASLFSEIRSGKKTATIRAGRRGIKLGPLMFRKGKDKIVVQVTAVRIKKLRNLSLRETRKAGERRASAVQQAMAIAKKYRIGGDDPITVIEFKLKNE